ncbi:sentrin-specific protease 1-like [Gopherus evgoodei]|uniref:sentrin-specific protease 1-like n=1 Tax=Gopherus evgoodei TaxID=1825980 RepID=UPI0011CFA0D5|nr:sentrin-specific protease 1-like [Gopherus evgoodei]
MFGDDVVFPEDVLENYTIPDLNRLVEDFFKENSMNMKSRHDADIALPLNNIAKAQEKQQRHYAKKTSKYGEIKFEVGDSVLLLNTRQRTRKEGVLESKYHGPYKIMSVEGKRVKLQTISGKQLGTMYSIAHLKPVKEPTTLAAESTSEGKTGTEIGVGDAEPETPMEEIREVDGTVSHDSKVENIEVTAIEKEEYIGQDVSNNDTSDADDSFDDMLTEEVEDKQWLLKVKLVMTSKHTERLEAKVRNIKLYGSSFHCLKPRSWISDEVIDAFLSCVVEKADGKVQAISSVVSTVILSGRATQVKVKSELLQNDILLLPYHTPGHWVLAIALMKKKELLIIDPLCDEIRYERTCLRNWRNFIKRLTSKSSSDWNSKIMQHPRQSDGHNCGPLILKFAETYLQHKDISTVETTQKANTAFRRHIAILLMKESESVEDYCIYCNLIDCEKESEDCTMVQCDSCKRWAHIPCITEGINQENLTYEKKEYNCKTCA